MNKISRITDRIIDDVKVRIFGINSNDVIHRYVCNVCGRNFYTINDEELPESCPYCKTSSDDYERLNNNAKVVMYDWAKRFVRKV